jgi:fructokinase
MDARPLYGCIEAGGTKFVVGVAAAPDDIREQIRIDTGEPGATLSKTISALYAMQERHGRLRAIGIASFGPVELDRSTENWGFITATTKPNWSNTDFAARVGHEFDLPVGFDTDVNGAGLAEASWGAGQGQRISVYVTVGTGIGGGAIVDNKPLFGLSHPEMGHFRPKRHEQDKEFAGICPFHGDCLEGLASGPAIKARWGKSLSELGSDHIAHEIIAYYLAQMAVTLQSIMEPGKIIFGGGVMATPGLLERVQHEVLRLGNGYFRGRAGEILVAPKLGDKAGFLGGLALAINAVL